MHGCPWSRVKAEIARKQPHITCISTLLESVRPACLYTGWGFFLGIFLGIFCGFRFSGHLSP